VGKSNARAYCARVLKFKPGSIESDTMLQTARQRFSIFTRWLFCPGIM